MECVRWSRMTRIWSSTSGRVIDGATKSNICFNIFNWVIVSCSSKSGCITADRESCSRGSVMTAKKSTCKSRICWKVNWAGIAGGMKNFVTCFEVYLKDDLTWLNVMSIEWRFDEHDIKHATSGTCHCLTWGYQKVAAVDTWTSTLIATTHKSSFTSFL